MSCEYESAVIDHACGAEIDADVPAHLEACPSCRRMFDEQQRLLQDIDRQLQTLLEIEPTPRFALNVMARVERAAFPWRKVILWSLPAAAAAILLVATLTSPRSVEQRAPVSSDTAVRPAVSLSSAPNRAPSQTVSTVASTEKPRSSSP